ncbi:MAG TPA: hypothetical protein PKX00_05105 [Opitutaceae bacterium]|nr:hypothetical protein [Opitutaceae bacterium]
MTSFSLPADYRRIQRVSSFHELVTTPFADGVNALCWPRALPGDFGEVVRLLGVNEGIVTLDEARLRALPVGAAGRAAIAVLLEDQQRLRDHGLSPNLDCILAYPRDDEPTVVPIDVHSFHADSATVETDTYLCTYHGAASEGLRNEEARRHVDDPRLLAELRKHLGGDTEAEFVAVLHELGYDLHYSAAPQAQPFGFGVGNLWRIAVEYPGSPVPPCIHRAPLPDAGSSPRLLLIS